MNTHDLPADLDPRFRAQIEGLKAMTEVLNSSMVIEDVDPCVENLRDTEICVTDRFGESRRTTTGEFIAENGLPRLKINDPKCIFNNDSAVYLFELQLQQYGSAVVPGFHVNLKK